MRDQARHIAQNGGDFPKQKLPYGPAKIEYIVGYFRLAYFEKRKPFLHFDQKIVDPGVLGQLL